LGIDRRRGRTRRGVRDGMRRFRRPSGLLFPFEPHKRSLGDFHVRPQREGCLVLPSRQLELTGGR
jgi:hypothetical protein